MKIPKAMRSLYFLICVLFLLSFKTSFGQLCKPAVSIYFEYNKSTLNKDNLSSLKIFLDSLPKSLEYYLELHGNADSTGKDTYNYNLSEKRNNQILSIINKKKLKIKVIKSLANGETKPKYDNSIEENRKLNRRVDIFIFPISNGKISLKGNRGSEIELDIDFFEPCSICETNPKIIEVLTEQDAKSMNIPLLTTEGEELITGGMVKFEYNCPKIKGKTPCKGGKIKLPSHTLDSNMTLWESIDTLGTLRWRERISECFLLEKYLQVTDPCLSNVSWENVSPWKNCDVKKPKPCEAKLISPSLVVPNYRLLKRKDSTLVRYDLDMDSIRFAACIDSGFFYHHEGLDSNNIRYYFNEAISKYQYECNSHYEVCYEIKLQNYIKIIDLTDSIYYFKLPKKYKFRPELSIIHGDTSFLIDKYKSKSNFFKFNKPIPKSKITFFDKETRQILFEIPVDTLKRKYKRKKKITKLKINKRIIKKYNHAP